MHLLKFLLELLLFHLNLLKHYEAVELLGFRRLERYDDVVILPNVPLLETPTAHKSVSACGKACASYPDCSLFSYNRITSECKLFPLAVYPADTFRLTATTPGLRYYAYHQDWCPVTNGFILDRETDLCFYASEVKTSWADSITACPNMGVGARLKIIKDVDKQEKLTSSLASDGTFKKDGEATKMSWPGTPVRQRTSSPVEEHHRKDEGFIDDISSVHSEISNVTDVQDGVSGTFAEYDIPGQERDLDQKQILENLWEENRRLHLQVMKKSKIDFDVMASSVFRSTDVLLNTRTSDDDELTAADTDAVSQEPLVENVSGGATLLQSADELLLTQSRMGFKRIADVCTASDRNSDDVVSQEPSVEHVNAGSTLLQSSDALLLTQTRSRSLPSSVDDVSTAKDTDVRVDEDVVYNLAKWRPVRVLQHMLTTRTRNIFVSVPGVSAATDTDQREDENVKQISVTEARSLPADRRKDEDIQQITETQTRDHMRVGSKTQTESKNIRDLMRTIRHQQNENAHLKMYINTFMSKALHQRVSLLSR